MANKSIGLLNIVFGADLRGFDRAMKKAQKSIAKFSKKMQATGKNLTTKVTLPIVGLGVAAVKMASDFEETDSKFKTVFGSIQKEAEDTAKTFQKSFDLSGQTSKKLLGDTGDLLVGFGFTEKAALDLSKQVNALAVDLASFTNFEGGAAGASRALTKALVGETESAKALGIVIRQGTSEYKARVEQIQNTQNVTILQAKAIANLEIAVSQSGKAIGDYARTSQNLANQTRALQEALKDVAVEFGVILIPIAIKVVELFKKMAQWFSELPEESKNLIVNISALVAAIGPLLIFFSSLVAAFGRFLPLISKVATKITKSLGPWGKLAALVLASAKGIWEMFTGERKLTKLERNLAEGKKEVNKELEKENGLLDNLLTKINALTPATKKYSDAVEDAIKTDFTWGMSPIDEEADPLIWTIELTDKQKELNAISEKFGFIMQRAMMDASSAQEGFFKSLFQNIKQAIKALLVQLAVLAAINIMLGRADTIGKAFSMAKDSLLGLAPAMANGGLATGPTMALVGEGAGTSMVNPEVIAPLDKLKNYMGGDMRVTGRLVGNDIYLSNEKAGVSRNRFI